MLTDLALPTCTDYDMTVLEQIEGKLELQGECWVWTGQTHQETPVRSYQGRRTSVRQLVYRMTMKPELECRLTNTCRTPGCLNPKHMVPWDGPGSAFGMNNRKLSPDAIAEILATPKELKGSGARLASRFGVSTSLISKVRRKRNYYVGRV